MLVISTLIGDKSTLPHNEIDVWLLSFVTRHKLESPGKRGTLG